MSKAQPDIFDRPLWENNEKRLVQLFCLALELLQQSPSPPPVDENQLNRKLHFCLRRANRTLHGQNGGFDHLPFYDSKSQPDGLDAEDAEREQKRPDFLWGFEDHQAPPERSSRYYFVECKRLGSPPSPTWVLNTNYVVHGVCRFRDPSHEYSKSSPSGAMIAYVQSMELDDILDDVNDVCRANGLTTIAVSWKGWQVNGVSRLGQEFSRSFPISPFQLRHLWLDLRT